MDTAETAAMVKRIVGMVTWGPIAWDWPSIGKIAVSAGIGSGGAQLLRDWISRWSTRRAQASYMAMRLAVILEFYAASCSELIVKNSNADHHPDEQYPNWTIDLPELPPFPDDADGWRAIDRTLAGRSLNLRNKIRGSQALISSAVDFTEDELGDVVQAQAAERGMEAWTIAKDLRRKHKIEQADDVWDFVEHLVASGKSAERAAAQRNSRKTKLMSTLSQNSFR